MPCHAYDENTKDAGILYESFWIKMSREIWDFWPYKLNPQNKFFEKKSTNPIPDMNL